VHSLVCSRKMHVLGILSGMMYRMEEVLTTIERFFFFTSGELVMFCLLSLFLLVFMYGLSLAAQSR
jgi:hypothetical protein